MTADNGNGKDSPFVRFILTAAVVLFAVGVGALWSMSNSVAKLEERVSAWTRIYEGRFEGLQGQVNIIQTRQRENEDKINRNSLRLDYLERRP